MTDETRDLLHIQLSVLKETMKKEGVILGLAVDKSDVNNSKIVLMDKDKYIVKRKMDGFSVSLTDFNKDLLWDV